MEMHDHQIDASLARIKKDILETVSLFNSYRSCNPTYSKAWVSDDHFLVSVAMIYSPTKLPQVSDLLGIEGLHVCQVGTL